MESTRPCRFYLLTVPRSASHLLMKILNLDEQPGFVSDGWNSYYFAKTHRLNLRDKNVADWTLEERSQMMEAYQSCFDDFDKHLQTSATVGQSFLIKEHVEFIVEPVSRSAISHPQVCSNESPWRVKVPDDYTSGAQDSGFNDTILPDGFLRTWHPIFLIKHPALAFPSRYRTVLDTEGYEAANINSPTLHLEMTLRWTRRLYDWYVATSATAEAASNGVTTWPIVLDSDDIITQPAVLVNFCSIVGLEPDKLKFTWTVESEELKSDQDPIVRRMTSTLSDSVGILNDKTAIGIDITAETRKWKEEFGNLRGEQMESWVRAAMPDYEFLKAKRLQPN